MNRTGSRGGAPNFLAAITCALLAALTAPGEATPASAKPTLVSSHAARVATVTLAIRHRVFKRFADLQTVRLDEEFTVGDTEFSARVLRYVPDFAMGLKTKEVTSRSTEPNNPAFQVVVSEKDVPQDTTWAFLNMPPHFARKSLLAFKIARIEFVGRDPIVADTSRADGGTELESDRP